MRNNLNVTKRVLYRLRQDYGMPVTLVQVDDITADYKTGTQVKSTTTYTLKKVVRLPRNLSSFFRLGAALGVFNRGGEVDRTVAEYIIDAATLPSGVVIDLRKHYLIVEGQRFNILKVTELDYRLGYLLTTEAVEGSE